MAITDSNGKASVIQLFIDAPVIELFSDVPVIKLFSDVPVNVRLHI